MKISVVIPAYNASSFLGETLRSVLQQTHPPSEILVIDDGSVDNTAEIAESFGPAVRVFRRPNSRQAASRNFGVEQATGDWIAFIDADDLWTPDKLARQVEEIRRTPHPDLCYTARIEFKSRNGEIEYGKVVPVPLAGGIQKALFRNTTFMPSSVLVRRSTYLAAGGFDTSFRVVEDWDLWLRLLHAGVRFAACQEPLLLYRVHPESVSHKALTTLSELKQIYRDRVLPYLPKSTRWIQHQISQSGQEAVAAYVLRTTGDRRHLRMMALSIARFPFCNPRRYKILAHMVCTRLGSRLFPARG